MRLVATVSNAVWAPTFCLELPVRIIKVVGAYLALELPIRTPCVARPAPMASSGAATGRNPRTGSARGSSFRGSKNYGIDWCHRPNVPIEPIQHFAYGVFQRGEMAGIELHVPLVALR